MKFKISKSSGFIHIFSDYDYQGIVETLITPIELSEYLNFRMEILKKIGDKSHNIVEQSLLGQFLTGDFNALPNNNYFSDFQTLEHKIEEWDISGIIKTFAKRIITDNHYSDYYKIIGEIAQLKRNELKEFKKRFMLSMKNCGGDELIIPYRVGFPRTNCGFVFVPLSNDMEKLRQQGLKNFTFGCKYDLQLKKCIGVSFYPDGDGWYLVEWCYIEYEWEYEEELDKLLKESNPFRKVKNQILSRYD